MIASMYFDTPGWLKEILWVPLDNTGLIHS